MTVAVDDTKCCFLITKSIDCCKTICSEVCPANAICCDIGVNIKCEKCVWCGNCIAACPSQALYLL